MFKIIYPNRWFFWAISAILVTGLFLWWSVEMYSLEQDLSANQNTDQAKIDSKTDKTAPAGAFNQAELKYKILSKFEPIFFCDPDFYPVARQDELTSAQVWLADADIYGEEYVTILAHTALTKKVNFTLEDQLKIYREHKKLSAVLLVSAGDKYNFHIHTGGESGGFAYEGIIDKKGNITILKKTESYNICPICTTPEI